MIRGVKGYNFLTALVRNKDMIKAVVAIITGYNFVAGFSWPTFFMTVGVSFVALVGKLLADFVDYVFSEVPVTP